MSKDSSKATFIAHLLWLDFVYRSTLATTLTISSTRLTLWLAWLGAVLNGKDEPRCAIMCMIDELETCEYDNYELYMARMTSRTQWYARWCRLLALAVKSDAIDAVGASISTQGVQRESQSTLQAFLWSTKGLEC